jgi:Fe-S-cluster containining protein
MCFECQRTGKCCSDPDLLVTLTHEDIYRIFSLKKGDFDSLVTDIDFIEVRDKNIRNKLVFPYFESILGSVILTLRKMDNGECIYYNPLIKQCNIYIDRPRTCVSFPFTFVRGRNTIATIVTLKGKEICEGLGKGTSIQYNRLGDFGNELLSEIDEMRFISEQVNFESKSGNSLTLREILVILLAYAGMKKDQKIPSISNQDH